MVLVIDNYDSFTYNLVQYLGELKQEVLVYRNDAISLDEITNLNPSHIVISPGPGTPNEAGISMQLVKRFSGQIPILGVCLGFQAIVQANGGKIVRAKEVMHGKVSAIKHLGCDVFTGLNKPFIATRYHSLVAEQKSLPKSFVITAWTEGKNNEIDEIMGVCHKELALYGVQFHPESILTEQGHQLLNNFLEMSVNG